MKISDIAKKTSVKGLRQRDFVVGFTGVGNILTEK